MLQYKLVVKSEIDKWYHRYHGASHAAVAPARFAPSPSPSRQGQAAESATAGPSRRAKVYMYCNYFTFGTALALVLLLLHNIPSRRAKYTMWVAKYFLVAISFSVAGTVALGTSEDWRYMLLAVFQIAANASIVPYFIWLVPDIIPALLKRIAHILTAQPSSVSV